jgi:iron complex transport system substrate-binding protein
VLQDAFKRPLPLPANPVRVISLSPATTEMVYAVGAEKRLLATTDDCNFPPAAKQKAHTGKFGVVNTEHLLARHPDLILATAEMAPKLTGLRHLPCPVLAVHTPTLASIATAVRQVGSILKAGGQAAVWETGWRKRLAAVQQQRPLTKPAVFFVLWPEPLMTVSDHTFIGDLIRLAGGRNIAGAVPAPYPLFSWESVIAGKADWVVYTASLGRKGLQGGRWPTLPAVRQGRTLELARDLVERPGPRSLDALELLNRALAPQRR